MSLILVYHVTLILVYHVILILVYHVTLILVYHVTLILVYHVILILVYHVTLILVYHVTHISVSCHIHISVLCHTHIRASCHTHLSESCHIHYCDYKGTLVLPKYLISLLFYFCKVYVVDCITRSTISENYTQWIRRKIGTTGLFNPVGIFKLFLTIFYCHCKYMESCVWTKCNALTLFPKSTKEVFNVQLQANYHQ